MFKYKNLEEFGHKVVEKSNDVGINCMDYLTDLFIAFFTIYCKESIHKSGLSLIS